MVLWLALMLAPFIAHADEAPLLLVPARVFDGAAMHSGWQVLVVGERIAAAGAKIDAPANARRIDLVGATLMPGFIEGHGHLFLHPYNETSWDDQVLHEPLALRTARAVNHARATLLAGFTTERDLGTEGAGYADVGLKSAIEQGIVPGPRLLVATRAIVASGAYGPKGFEPGVEVPQGAEEASGDEVVRAVRRQIAAGADSSSSMRTIAGARARRAARPSRKRNCARPPRPPTMPAASSRCMRPPPKACAAPSRPASTRSSTAMAARPRSFAPCTTSGIALCPTLAAGDAIARYRGWDGKPPAPASLEHERKSFAAARAARVTICAGGDVGVFAHGENARELELMQESGMPAPRC